MTLTGRLTLFFLTTLACVLGGFSVTLYFLARAHLHHQADERLEAALNTLTASIEIAGDGVEWEPVARPINLGAAADGGRVLWLIRDDQDAVVDRSSDAALEVLPAAEAAAQPGGHWLIGRRTVGPSPTGPMKGGPSHDEHCYNKLFVAVGVSVQAMYASLRQLAFLLTGLSAAIWLASLLVGRVICRRALLPVRVMAASARDMDAADLAQRLPEPRADDELRELSRAFNSLLERVHESYERQRRFTGDASHQLRTPLAAVLGQVEVALRRERTPDEYRRVLETVQSKAERLRRIVESLLFLARADGEAELPQPETLNINDWAADHVLGWADHPRFRDIVLEKSDRNLQARVQPAFLGELVDILLDNACVYSEPATPVIIRVRQSEDSTVCLDVEDHGFGMSAEDLKRVFTPFFRSSATRHRRTAGLGLGLSIARRLGQAFGAHLTVTSQPGRGSCFTLHLPKA